MASLELHKIVLPPVLAVSVLYPTAFLGSMWLTAADDGSRDFTHHVTSGEIRYGWRYDVYARPWPQGYMVDVTAPTPGAGSLCVVEVRGAPKPAQVVQGEGSALYVRFEGPLKAGGDTLRVDLFDALEHRCAALVDNGLLIPDPLSAEEEAEEAPPPAVARMERLRALASGAGRGI